MGRVHDFNLFSTMQLHSKNHVFVLVCTCTGIQPLMALHLYTKCVLMIDIRRFCSKLVTLEWLLECIAVCLHVTSFGVNVLCLL